MYYFIREKAFTTNMSFYEQFNKQCSLHYKTIWKYVKNRVPFYFLYFLFYVIKEKAALELEGVLVSLSLRACDA